MKYIMGIMFGIVGFICIIKPEFIRSETALHGALCFGLATLYFNMKED